MDIVSYDTSKFSSKKANGTSILNGIVSHDILQITTSAVTSKNMWLYETMYRDADHSKYVLC